MLSLRSISQTALWMGGLTALVLVDDVTAGFWAPLATGLAVVAASHVIARLVPVSEGPARSLGAFAGARRTESCDYACHASLSPGVGGIQR